MYRNDQHNPYDNNHLDSDDLDQFYSNILSNNSNSTSSTAGAGGGNVQELLGYLPSVSGGNNTQYNASSTALRRSSNDSHHMHQQQIPYSSNSIVSAKDQHQSSTFMFKRKYLSRCFN